MPQELAKKIRAKYPGVYDDLSDMELEAKILAKYPEYKDLATPPSESSTLGKLWSGATTPIINLRETSPEVKEATELFAQEHPWVGKPANFALDVLSGLSSPLNVGFAGLGLGSSLATRIGSPILAKAANIGTKALSAPVIAEGVQNIYEGHPILGGLEAIGGIMGLRSKLPKIGATWPVTHAKAGEIPIVERPWRATPDEILRGETAPTQLNLPIEAPTDPIKKLVQALKESKPLNKEQAEIYRAERAEKFARASSREVASQESARDFMAQLAGEHTKVSIEPLKLEQPDVDSLFKIIGDTQLITTDKAHAITGLNKLLVGGVPQPNEVRMLETIFGKDVTAAISQVNPKIKRGSLVHEIVNMPRALQASLDLSAPFRQGLPLIHTKAWWTSWDDMVKAFGSEKSFRGTMDAIMERPNYKRIVGPGGGLRPSFAETAGLKLTDLADLTSREEAFMSTLAERIPVIGKGVRASNRAYVAFLDKLRADNFDNLIALAEKQGLTPKKNLVLAKQIADYVNNASGRGSLGKLERSAVVLNDFFFSPRLIASRVQMMNPKNYVFANPFVRKQYLKSMIATASAWMSIASLGKLAGGEVSLDPDSADFGKIKIGNTRLDPAGGFQQYLVLLHRLGSGEYTSSTTGQTQEFGKKFGGQTRLDALSNFIQNKLAPVPSTIAGGLAASTYRPFEVGDTALRLFTPMFLQDLSEIAQEDPNLLPFAIPGALGFGVQTYGERGAQSRLLPESIFSKEMDITYPEWAR